ncbi:MAG: hypothetical protein ACUVX9_18685 [Anaerolineae bacterium]
MGESTSAWKERVATALRNPRTTRVVAAVLVPVLLFTALWLPPISLGVRLFHLDYPLLTRDGGSVAADNGAQLTVAPGALSGQLRLLLQVINTGDPAAGKGSTAEALKAVPANLHVRGPVYTLAAYGALPTSAVFTAPLPADVAGRDSLDLYAWTGQAWQWLPAAFSDTQVQGHLSGMPRLLAVMETNPQGLVVGVGAPDTAAVDAAPLDLAAELYLGGLSLSESGAVDGHIALEAAPAGLLVLPTLSNTVDGAVRADWVASHIADAEARQAHVKAIVEAVQKGGYKGLSLEYGGLGADQRQAFTAFVQELAAALHGEGKLLTVRVDAPALVDGLWNTAGYDWAALGQVADLVRIPALAQPAAYGPGGAMEQVLRLATSQVNRAKLQLVISAYSHEQVGEELRALIYGDALSLASCALQADGDTTVLPGAKVAVKLTNLGSGLKEDADSGHTIFAFKDARGVEHKVWVENAASVARKLALAGQFSLHGVAIDDLAGTANDAQIWDTVRIARASSARGAAAPAGTRYSVVWKVVGRDGAVIDEGVSPADQPIISWTAAEEPGDYTLSVAISADGGQSTVGEASSLALVVPSPTPSPTPTNTPTPAPTAVPKPPTPAPVAQAPAPSTGVAFGVGIQVHLLDTGDQARILDSVQALGCSWIKQQVEWFRFNPAPGVYNWGGLDAVADACAARGIKVMFSVCKAPNWARPGDDDKSVAGPPADPNTMATFMREMAAHFRGRVQAYEIWNEQNLWYEWGGRGGRLSAAKYVDLLRACYGAIKSVDRNIIVISGAMTPTGWTDGDTAIDDQLYLRQMYDAGLRSVCDAVGAHPSGFNLPPDADWRSFEDPSASFRGPFNNRHPSWSFRGTMEGYRNIMIAYGDGNKKIIPTEFGWASSDGIGAPARGYEYAADNSAQEQADYIVRAFQMGRNWGFVGPMFLWNLNFAPMCGNADEKSAFSIVSCGWGPRPAFHALANMPK